MSEKELPNLFITLGIDPDLPWHQVEFEKQLEEKRREWARLVNRPDKKGLEAKRNLGLIPELKRIAADENLLRQQAEAAKKERASAQAEVIKKLDNEIQLKELRRYILEADFNDLLGRYKASISEAELRKRIKVPILKDPPEPVVQKQEALDPNTAKQIRDLLDALSKADLYDFLSLPEPTATDKLREKAQALYDQVGKKGTKSADDTAAIQVCGFCFQIFANNEARAKYTETLRQAGYEGLISSLDAAAGKERRVEPAQLEKILLEARRNKLNQEEAFRVIQEHAKQRYTLIIPANLLETVSKQQRCGNCGQMNEASAKHCVSCSRLLKEACPNCGTLVASEERACGSCGFMVGNRGYVSYLVNDSEQAYLEHEYEAAVRLLEQAREDWTSNNKDPLAHRIATLESKLITERKQQEDLLAMLRALVSSRQFYEARKHLPQLQKILPPKSEIYEEIRKTVAGEIQRAETQLAAARGLAGKVSSDDEILAYQQVVAICRDCVEAVERLKSIPPEPPENLKALTVGQLVQLSWSASKSKQISYSVVRKQGARPVAGTDGTALATVTGLSFDDMQCEVGISTFYAVYASREGVLSARAAVLSAPVLLLQEVKDLTVSVADKQVHLQWKLPPNASDVLVLRSENGHPKTAVEGRRVPLLDKTHAADSGLVNNRHYYYTVFAVFRGLSGEAVTSAGVKTEAVPQAPPDPVAEMSLTPLGEGEARKLKLQWSPPEKGQVLVLKARRSPGLGFGAVIARADLLSYGALLSPGSSSQVLDDIEAVGQIYYLPVVVFQESAYIGKEYTFVSVDDVRELSIQKLGYALRLQWSWPENCTEALVAINYTGWGERTSAAALVPLTRAQYEIRGYYDLLNPPQTDHYITVFAAYGLGQEKVFAAGARKLARLTSRILLEYEIKLSRFSRKISLEVRTNGKGTLPALLLVRKRNTLPLQRLDGEMILRIEPRPLEKEKERFTVELDASAGSPYSYAKLYLEDDSLYEDITIRHPDREKMRLF